VFVTTFRDCKINSGSSRESFIVSRVEWIHSVRNVSRVITASFFYRDSSRIESPKTVTGVESGTPDNGSITVALPSLLFKRGQ